MDTYDGLTAITVSVDNGLDDILGAVEVDAHGQVAHCQCSLLALVREQVDGDVIALEVAPHYVPNRWRHRC